MCLRRNGDAVDGPENFDVSGDRTSLMQLLQTRLISNTSASLRSIAEKHVSRLSIQVLLCRAWQRRGRLLL